MGNIINNYYSELIVIMVLIIIIGIVIMIIPLFKNIKINNDKLLGITKKEFNILNEDQLKKDIFDLYTRVEIAKSKFDYDTLKELLTSTLYEEEEQKLQTLKRNKQKLVSTNIKLQELKILSIKNIEQLEIIDIYLYISKYDYIINNKKELIRGTDKTQYQIEYKITIEKNNKYFKLKEIECTGKWIKND